MKLIHLSDLHIGKRWNEYSLIQDQRYIFDRIVDIVQDIKPDAVMIAGDVYDKSVPTAEAVELFDKFLYGLSKTHAQIFIISGNHDSAERIAFASKILDGGGIHMSPVYDGNVSPWRLFDRYGAVDIYMLPFIKPIHVRNAFADKAEQITSYQTAMECALSCLPCDKSVRNVLITHQFITGAARCDSEEKTVGGADNIDAGVFDGFDYVALGHIHGPQNVMGDRVRYCGTPLKYSFSEMEHEKTVTVVELFEKGRLEIKQIPLKPLREVMEIRGTFNDVTAKEFYDAKPFKEAFLRITLTDETDIPNAQGLLRAIYPNMLEMRYDNSRTNAVSQIEAVAIQEKSPIELCQALYSQQNGKDMTDEQSKYLDEIILQVWETENETD